MPRRTVSILQTDKAEGEILGLQTLHIGKQSGSKTGIRPPQCKFQRHNVTFGQGSVVSSKPIIFGKGVSISDKRMRGRDLIWEYAMQKSDPLKHSQLS